ncbi:MAG: hypothetical protein K9N51_02750 [Candidatus Pacebacteria bacterium]|nr:hypothetical protein [Candidatus Paceibacterota bacterium]
MPDKTHWFADCTWGVFCHYLTSPETPADDWNRQVDAFDVNGLAEQLHAVHASYFVITIGQGSGHYCAPNATYDRIAGVHPSKCSKRDLVSDLYDALHPLGIKLLVYAPADGSWADHEARKGLGMPRHWNDGDFEFGTDAHWGQFRWVEFMRNWEAVCRDWSLRWKSKVSGWWIDGCYGSDVRYPEAEEPNFRTFAEALRAGNPESIPAFNAGVRTPVIHHTVHEDYTAGEVSRALPECEGPFVTGQSGHKDRYHILSYLGESWCEGDRPRFPDELVRGYTKYVTDKKGVVTWDVPIMKNGLIPEPFIEQLKAID